MPAPGEPPKPSVNSDEPVPPCPACGHPREPRDRTRLCPACQNPPQGSLGKLMVPLLCYLRYGSSSYIGTEQSLLGYPHSGELCQLACRCFGHAQFSQATWDALIEWLVESGFARRRSIRLAQTKEGPHRMILTPNNDALCLQTTKVIALLKEELRSRGPNTASPSYVVAPLALLAPATTVPAGPPPSIEPRGGPEWPEAPAVVPVKAGTAEARERQPEGNQAHGAPASKGASAENRAPAIILGDSPEDEPTVRGKKKPRLTPGQYHVVKALLDAYPERLSKDTLARRAHVEGPVNMIDRLRKRDEDWAAVLDKPGQAHGGYGVRM